MNGKRGLSNDYLFPLGFQEGSGGSYCGRFGRSIGNCFYRFYFFIGLDLGDDFKKIISIDI